MCVVSNVGDHYQKTWPWGPWEQPLPQPIVPFPNPFQVSFTPAKEKTALDLLEELMRVARALDAALGLPDCEDATKTAWIESVRQRVREHEHAKIEKRLQGSPVQGFLDGP